MEEERTRGLSLVDVGVDYTKVEPIQHKRVLAFINHFAIHTAHFLNRFSSACEEKLSSIEERLRRLDVTINILETKLSSIPGLEAVTGEAYNPPASIASAGSGTSTRSSAAPGSNSSDAANANAPSTAPQSSAPPPQSAPAAPPPPAAAQPSARRDSDDSDSDFDDDASTATGATSGAGGGGGGGTPVSKDPRYAKYFNLLKVGVPVVAFRNKMIAEGLDPDLMENPDAPVPTGGGGGGGMGGMLLRPGGDSDDDDDDDDDDEEEEDERDGGGMDDDSDDMSD